MSTMEVTILGGPHDGLVVSVAPHARRIRVQIMSPAPAVGNEKQWVPFQEVDVPIYLTRNGYRADWALAEPTDPDTRTTGGTP